MTNVNKKTYGLLDPIYEIVGIALGYLMLYLIFKKLRMWNW